MPLYRVRIEAGGGRPREEQKGFFNDEGALAYARRLACGRPIELWRGAALVHRDQPAVQEPVQLA